MLSDKLNGLKVSESENKEDSFERKTFKLKDIDSYVLHSVDFQQSQEITCFSVDINNQVWFDDREMRYYYPPTTKDLNGGYEQQVILDFESNLAHLDILLDALTDLKHKTNEEHMANIVTWRGIISKILCTPYARKDPWELRTTQYNGTIFIEKLTDQKRKDIIEANDKEKLKCYWGFKFESLCTAKKPPSEVTDQDLQDRSTAVVNTTPLYCSVVKTKLGKNTIIMGAEIDCCLDKKLSNPFTNYIELKTIQAIETKQNIQRFARYTLMKIWAQSYIVGVPKVICGFRNDDGQVVDLREMKTEEIPGSVQWRRNIWKPSVCLSFVNEVLEWIVSSIKKDDPTVTYSIKFDEPFQEITIECTYHSDVFLTQRFIDGTIHNEIGGPRAKATPHKTK